jgi:hypothetical protein
VTAYGCLGDAEAPSDLGVGVPGGDQVQQLGLPGGELGDGVAAPLGIQEGLVQVRAQQREERPVPLGEVRPGLTEEEHPDGPPGTGGPPCRIRQAQLELGMRVAVASAIFVLACYATGAGDYCRAAQLTGAHDVIDATVIDASPNYYWTPLDQRVRDDNQARLRLALGEGEFNRAYSAGRALDLDQAVDLALGRTRGEPAAMLRTVTGQ